MFNFGSPYDTATIYWDKASAVRGPKIPRRPAEEMKLADLKNALVYARIAYTLAEADLQGKEVLNVLIEQYDEIFEAFAQVDPSLRKSIESNIHKYLGGYTYENILKFKRLAGIEA